MLCACSKGHLVALDIIRGLVFLHSNKVVHADLKAKNVLLTQNAGTPASVSTAFLLGPVPAPMPLTYTPPLPLLMYSQKAWPVTRAV